MLEYRDYFKKLIQTRKVYPLWILVIGILLWVMYVFHPMLKAYFVSDDYYIWRVVRTLHFRDTYRLFLPKVLGGFNITDYTEHYIPLTAWLMWLIAFPLKMQPFFAHLVSLGLHLINILLVIKLGYAITNNKKTAVLSGLIFGTFPATTEAVNYITANLFLLGTLFYIAALILILQYFQSGNKVWFVLHIISFSLGLYSCEVAITIPLTVLLIYWVKEKKPVTYILWNHRKLFLAYLLPLSVYTLLRYLSIGTLNFFKSTGHYEVWAMSRMFIVYVMIVVVLILMRVTLTRWIPREIKSRESKLWFLLLLVGTSWLPTAKLLTQERYLYLPATFASLFAGYIFFILYQTLNKRKLLQRLFIVVLGIGLVASSVLVYRSSIKWLRAGTIAYSIVVGVSRVLESLPNAHNVYLINVPDSWDGAYIHRSFFTDAIEFYSGKRPERFIFTPLTLGVDTAFTIAGPNKLKLMSKNGFSLFMPILIDGKRVIEWPNKYKAVETGYYTLDVEFLDPDFNWNESYVYGFEKGSIQKIPVK